MAAIDIITRYFPQLTPEQIEHFTQLDALYRDWNAKINVISRKDIDALYEHHVLHSLGIAQMIRSSLARTSSTSVRAVASQASPWRSSSPSASSCWSTASVRRSRSQQPSPKPSL